MPIEPEIYCSFCQKSCKDAEAMVVAYQYAICDSCVWLCLECVLFNDVKREINIEDNEKLAATIGDAITALRIGLRHVLKLAAGSPSQ